MSRKFQSLRNIAIAIGIGAVLGNLATGMVIGTVIGAHLGLTIYLAGKVCSLEGRMKESN